MERLALENLIRWNNDKHCKPLVIFGARQVGKTYLIKELFAKKYYKNNYIYIDFKKDDDERNYFANTVDPDKLLTFLSLKHSRQIDKNVLLIFDEVQECLNALTSLKYFNQEHPEIHIICSGSMVRIKTGRNIETQNFLFPVGKIHTMFLYPLNFEEYLLNTNKILLKTIKEAYDNKKPLDDYIHNMALEKLYEFLLIGGMPDVVNTFIETKMYIKALNVTNDIYSNYLDDMNLYQASKISASRTKLLFNNIYSELNKDNSNFKFSNVLKDAKKREFENPLYWLETAGIIYPCYQLKERVTIPLTINNPSIFKIYMHDNGLLAKQSEIDRTVFINSSTRNTMSGVFLENYVASELSFKGIKLFYWKGKNTSEFEFIVNISGNPYPIDVKKTRGKLNSLENYKNHNKYFGAIKISSSNLSIDQKELILNIPLYMTPFLADEIYKTNHPNF